MNMRQRQGRAHNGQRSCCLAEWDGLLDSFEPFWLITRYDDVMRISKDNTTFLNNPKPVVFAAREATAFARAATGSNMLVDSLVVFDAPIHPKYRTLTQDWFMPRNLKMLENEICMLADHRVDAMIAAGTQVDFVKQVAAPVPLHVIMQILGFPHEDERRMFILTQQMFGGQDADLSGSGMANMTQEQILQFAAGEVKSFEDYFAQIAADCRANPTDDVASVIANAKVDGKPLPDRDMAGYYIIMAAAGHDGIGHNVRCDAGSRARSETICKSEGGSIFAARPCRRSDPLDHIGSAFHAHRNCRCRDGRTQDQKRRLDDA